MRCVSTLHRIARQEQPGYLASRWYTHLAHQHRHHSTDTSSSNPSTPPTSPPISPPDTPPPP
eukprot:2378821-Rhodomonas_salina.1